MPALIAAAGDQAGWRYVEFFAANIANDHTRRGYARACMEALVDWFREVGAGYIHLTASPDAESLYASMGFRRRPDPLMQLDL